MNPRASHLISLGKNLICIGVLLTAVVAVGAAQNPQQQNPQNPPRTPAPVAHNIRGKIYLPSGQYPDRRIRVVLELTSGGRVAETFSDSVGNFEFRQLPSNTYKVVVPGDFEAFETTDEVIELFGTFPRTFNVQVFLKDKDGGVVIKPKNKILSAADIQEVPKNAKKAYDKALKEVEKKKHEQAITHLSEALKIFPEYMHAINKLGEQYLAMNKMEEAKDEFKRVIAVNDKFALPHINLGLIYLSEKKYEDAKVMFETANVMDDSYPMAHLNLGLVLMMMDPPDLDKAAKEITRAMDMAKGVFVYAHKYMFNLEVRRNDLPKAAGHLETYLKEARDAPDAANIRQVLAKVKEEIAKKNQIQIPN